MNTQLKNGVLTVFTESRIDTANAPTVEGELMSLVEKQPHDKFVIDAQALTYISSSGLRVMLRLAKKEPGLEIINVCPEVYEIFNMTGFTEILKIRKAFKCLSVEGCPVIGAGAKGTVYRFDPETVVKVYKDPDSLPYIMRERELARRAFVLGIPTAISYDVVRVGNSYGSVFELLNARSFSQCIAEEPDKLASYAVRFARMLKGIHSIGITVEDVPNIKNTVYAWLNWDRDVLSPAEFAAVKTLVDSVPDTKTLLHGDFHTNNILEQNGEALLIDMDTLSFGHPVFELANVYIAYVGFGEVDPAVIENFMHLKYDVCTEFMKLFLREYFNTYDAELLSSVTDKIRLLSYVHLMSHTLRRGVKTETDAAVVKHSHQMIAELIKTVDTLEF